MMIKEGGIWNLKEVLRQNPVPSEEAEGKSFSESLKRTVIAQGNHFSVLLVQAQPQTVPYLHVHEDHDEMIYILEGEGEFIVGDVAKLVKPGDIIYAPAGTVHAPNFPVKGVRLVVYAPCFDPDNPDRKEVTQVV